MNHIDPFAQEQARRNLAIEQAERDRLRALLDAEQASLEGTWVGSMNSLMEVGALQDQIPASSPTREQMRREDHAGLPYQSEDPKDRRHVRIGGWEAGNSDQDLQSTRFEIEAERAIFLGKGSPAGANEKLTKMHEELHKLHVAYQRTGDPSLLIGIADMTAKYTKAVAKHQRGR